MKKFKKIMAAVSAAVMCAVSMTSFISNAAIGGWLYAPDQTVTPYTVSFTARNVKYSLWQEASDYLKFDEKTKESQSFVDKDGKTVTCYDGGVNVYIGETGRGIYGYYYRYYRYEDGTTFARTETAPLYFAEYMLENENDKKTLESYLTDNNIPYTALGNMELHFDEGTIVYYRIELQLDKEATYYDDMNVYMDIKENTGFVCQWGLVERAVQIADVENALPEKTLDGDANVDGKVDIADAAAIIQHIGNPAKYALTIQGEANADCYNTGDGITGMDAIAVQKLEAGLIESFDEA